MWVPKFLRDRKRVILDRQSKDPYLVRYYIFLKERRWFPFNIFVHKFLMSDPADLHDHPWPYATLILKGGYYEWTPVYDRDGRKITEVSKWCGPGSFRIRGANSLHRIELDPDVTAWTLFMPGPQQREWGFETRKGWVQHEKYIK
jgi:hypothetical protein